MNNVITIRQLGLDLNYLTLNETERHAICQEIVKKSLSQVKTIKDYQEKVNAIESVLQNSIKTHESKEEFEMAQIFLDVQTVLKNEFKGKSICAD